MKEIKKNFFYSIFDNELMRILWHNLYKAFLPLQEAVDRINGEMKQNANHYCDNILNKSISSDGGY